MEDMTAYKSAPELMKDANLYTAVPQLVLGLFDDIFTEDSQPKSNIGDYLKRNLKSNPLGLVQFAKLGMKAVKNL